MIWRAFLCSFLWTLMAINVAQAHSPYFTRFEKVDLPDHSIGEMRIIAGDGIFFADPTRLVFFDAENHLVARSRRWEFVDIVCKSSRNCIGYEYRRGKIVELQPETFKRVGKPVPADISRENLWDVEDGKASWGTITRPVIWSELVWLEFRMFARYGFNWGLVFAGAMAAAALPLAKPPSERTTKNVLIWAILAAIATATCLVAMGLVYYVVLLSAPAYSQIVMSLSLGAVFAWYLFWSRRRKANRSRVAQGNFG